MFIDIKTNPPPDGSEVLVKLDDGSEDGKRGVAHYSADLGFVPVNISVYYRTASMNAEWIAARTNFNLQFRWPVVAWKHL